MVWQDTVIAIANVLFGYSLIYQVWKGWKDKKSYLTLRTSFLTTIGLYAMAISFFTLNLTMSGIIMTLTGTLWLLLFIQGLLYKKN